MFVLLLLVSIAFGSAACSSDDGGDKNANARAVTTTTLSVAEAAHAYEARGPYPVGITTLTLEGGVKVEVWYPAVAGSTGTDTYDMRKLVPKTVTNLLTANVPATYTIDATRDADVADGRFPLVLFSHGASGIRQQSTFLTSHLASWGMIVAAPDHWSRDLFHILDRVLGGTPVKANDPVDDLRMTRQLLVDADADASSRFNGHVDSAHVAAVGHSAGGGTVLGFAGEPGVAGYVSLASGILRGGPPTTGPTTTTTAPAQPPALRDVPSLFMAGARDAVAPWKEVTKPAYDAAPAPSRMWVIDRAGHNAFDDFCTFGNGKGIIGVAEASGLGAFLDAQPMFRRLGEDGCLPPAIAVKKTFPIVNHTVTAFLREVFGIDPVPVGLGPDVSDQYAVPVTISEKLSK